MRRAEQHAESSGRDPRHVGVPRETGDDILKKVHHKISTYTYVSVSGFLSVSTEIYP